MAPSARRRTSSALALAALALVAVGLFAAHGKWHAVATPEGEAVLLTSVDGTDLDTGDVALMTSAEHGTELRALHAGEQVEGDTWVPLLTLPHVGRAIAPGGDGIATVLLVTAGVACGAYALKPSRRIRLPIAGTAFIATVAIAVPALAAFTVPSSAQNVVLQHPGGATLSAPSNLTCTWTGASSIGLSWTVGSSWAASQQLQRRIHTAAFANYGSALSGSANSTTDSSATSGTNVVYNYRLNATAYNWGSSYTSSVPSTDCTGTINSIARANSSAANSPEGLFYWEDSNGAPYLYVADTINHIIRKVDLTTGYITRVVGTGSSGFNEPCSPASACQLNQPEGVYVKANGDVLIADSGNHRIRKVTAAGVVSTIAGSGTNGWLDAAVLSARFDRPVGITMVNTTIYVADRNSNKLRSFTEGGNVITPAGGTASHADGTCGTPPGSPGSTAGACLLNTPEGIASDSSGNIYIADRQNNRIRVYNTNTFVMTTLAGGNLAGFADGTALASNMDKPEAVWVVANGDVYVADRDNSRIRKISGGTISTVAGTGTTTDTYDGFAATSSGISFPRGVAVSTSGELYYSATGHHSVRRITSGGVQQTVIGSGSSGLSGENTYGFIWRTSTPRRMAVDASGNIYWADSGTHMVRKYTASTGAVSIVAGNGILGSSGDTGQATAARLSGPSGVAISGSTLYIADTGNHKIRSVNLGTGIINTFAGNGTGGYIGEGVATSFRLNSPTDVAVASNGDVYIADSANNRIRKVASGTISTYAGTGTASYSGDGAAATSATLNNPTGIAFDASNNLYIADTTNNRVRLVTASNGNITLYTGDGTASSAGDSGAPASAKTNGPQDVFVNGSTVYIAERSGSRIRKVVSNVITTALGNGTATSTGDMFRYNEATIVQPVGLAVDPSGNFFVSEDAAAGSVRRVKGGV